MHNVRLLVALVLLALVLGGFVYSVTWIRVAPLALSAVWALVELNIERRRRRRERRSAPQ